MNWVFCVAITVTLSFIHSFNFISRYRTMVHGGEKLCCFCLVLFGSVFCVVFVLFLLFLFCVACFCFFCVVLCFLLLKFCEEKQRSLT